MARSRKYGWNGENPAKEPSGQALIVLNGMKSRAEEMHTGKEWAEIIGGDLKTRQDPYRVVLYYILIFKGRGVIRTQEEEIEATTRTVEGDKHGVVVRTDSQVDITEMDETAEEEADLEDALQDS